jgi:2-haloacid dehalogenase
VTRSGDRRPIEAVVFDLGGVIIDWNPRHLYRKLFPGDEAGMERFLAEVCTPEWNAALDRGRPFAEGIAELKAAHPDRVPLIEAYRDRWIEMLDGAIPGSVEILGELRERGVPFYALSNWSAETYPEAEPRFDFLAWFRGVLISGEVGVAKPEPAIFERLCERFRLQPGTTLFVDDAPPNVEAARGLGFAAALFRGAPDLRARLVAAGLLDGLGAPSR